MEIKAVQILKATFLDWIGEETGFLFVNQKGLPITPCGILQKLKERALNFLDKNNDLVLLADLLGHASVKTARIYLQRSVTSRNLYGAI